MKVSPSPGSPRSALGPKGCPDAFQMLPRPSQGAPKVPPGASRERPGSAQEPPRAAPGGPKERPGAPNRPFDPPKSTPNRRRERKSRFLVKLRSKSAPGTVFGTISEQSFDRKRVADSAPTSRKSRIGTCVADYGEHAFRTGKTISGRMFARSRLRVSSARKRRETKQNRVRNMRCDAPAPAIVLNTIFDRKIIENLPKSIQNRPGSPPRTPRAPS